MSEQAKQESATILVVDDDPGVGRVLSAQLVQDGYRATWAPSAEVALATLEKSSVDLVVSDVRMPGMDGLQLLRTLRVRQPELPVVLLTAHGTVPLAVEAMREGAADFLQKPWDRDELRFVLNKALANSKGAREAPPQRAQGDTAGVEGMVGSSAVLEAARADIRKAAPSVATVLIRGETGTGKELAARAIHSLSPRAKQPFVRVNCGAMAETLIESELFGHEKGAFTGAIARKPGRVELAQGGTLFLDEIGELSLTSQVKLLNLIQQKEFTRVGGTETLKADVRFVAATHRDLAEMVRQGTFREDLRYRLDVVPVNLPPLRARGADISLLAKHFVGTLAPANGRPGAHLLPDAWPLLEAQPWPGNVRQLQNFIERLIVLAPQDAITRADVEAELKRDQPAGAPVPTGESLDARRKDAEREAVEQALARARGNRSLAARLLGVSRRTLYNKLEVLGLA